MEDRPSICCLSPADDHPSSARRLAILAVMVGFTPVALAALAATGALAFPAGNATELEKRQTTPNSEGWHDGYYYSWWSDGGAQATYTNLEGGTYEISWGDGGNLVGGKGWNPGLNARYVSPKTDNRIVIRPRSFELLKAFLTPTS